jgi:AcrR family transcriptional regulator
MRDGTKTKESIDRTSLRLFVEKGVAETTIRDIASAAGIAEGTMYRHYASKDELAWSLFSKNFTALSRELDRLQKEQPGTREKIEAMIRCFCTLFDDDPILFSYLCLHALHGQIVKMTPDMPHAMEVLIKVIDGGMDRGEITKGNPTVTASMVMGIVLQMATSKVYGRFDESMTDLADTIVAASWRVVGE